MTYVVTENCIRCKFMDCVEVCPVDCFYVGENMLVIHPDECIDCGVCEPECPVDAIKPDTEPGLEKWLEINRYGGRLLLLWGVAVAATAAIGAFLPFKDWIIYNWTALGVALGGLAACVGLIYRRTRRGK